MSKEEYWKNRKAGKRGQGELPILVKQVDVSKIKDKQYNEVNPLGNRAYRRSIKAELEKGKSNDS